LNSYATILETMKANNDPLWQGVCLESYQVSQFLEALENNNSLKVMNFIIIIHLI